MCMANRPIPIIFFENAYKVKERKTVKVYEKMYLKRDNNKYYNILNNKIYTSIVLIIFMITILFDMKF